MRSPRVDPVQPASIWYTICQIIIIVVIVIAQTQISQRLDCHFDLFILSLECNVYAISISCGIVKDRRNASDLRAVPANVPVGGRRNHVVAEMKFVKVSHIIRLAIIRCYFRLASE